jgi:hypothetical protein
MQADKKKGFNNGSLQRITPIHRQLLSMNLYIGYPNISKGHKLTSLTPVGRTDQSSHVSPP